MLWQLTGGAVHSIEVGNASRTQLLDIHAARWDGRLLDLFGVPDAALPTVRPSVGHHGTTARDGLFDADVPILAVAADSHAALFGHGCFEPGQVKATYDTGSSIVSPTSDPRRPAEAVAQLAEGVDDTGGVHLVTAFAGLGAPHGDEAARGLIAGLTVGSSRAQVARAAIESIAFQVRDVVEVPEPDAVGARGPLHADGGASRNATLMQFQADLLGREVFVSSSTDFAAMGAAALAGGQLGWWDPREAVARADDPTVHDPRVSEDERDGRYAAWLVAVSRAYAGQADDHGPP